MVITYISVYFILSTKSNNVRLNRIIYLQQSTIDYNMFFLGYREEGEGVLGRKGRKYKFGSGLDGEKGGGCGSASVKGVRWSSMQAFLRSCSVTRVTVDSFFLFFFFLF